MSGTTLAGLNAMVRDSDSVAEFRFAMKRIVEQLDKHDERLNQNASDTREHILRCEGANIQTARDVSELRAEMKSLRELVVLIAKIGIPLLAFILAVQILGVERAWNVTDSIKSLRHAIPLNP